MKIYCVYPISDPNLNIGKNPYIKNMVNAINSKGNKVINHNTFSNYGVFSLLNYVSKSDVYIFNWTESIPFRKFGLIQSLFLPILLILLRLLNKRIIFIFHNKFSHSGKNFISSINLFFSLIFSHKIVTHSHEGVNYLKSKFRNILNQNKVKFVYHPAYTTTIEDKKTVLVKYDYIIWGSISPYKGVLDFLYFLKKKKGPNKIKILICGKVSSKDFKNKLDLLDINNIDIIDEFITENNLSKYIASAKNILFVYSSSSVLSSGALIKSLNYGKPIIGPRVGAFKDLENIGLINCFNNYDDIFFEDINYSNEKVKDFLKLNSWSNQILNFL